MRILLIEDDPHIGDGLYHGLIKHGFTVDWFKNGQHGRDALSAAPYDAVVLDLGLPQIDGMDILAYWRQQRQSTPVLILTARDALPDRLAGLNGGADELGRRLETYLGPEVRYSKTAYDDDTTIGIGEAYGTGKFGQIAVRWGLVTTQQVWEAWARQMAYRRQFVEVKDIGIDTAAVARVTVTTARSLGVVPLRLWGDQLVVAVPPDVDDELLDVEDLTDRQAESVLGEAFDVGIEVIEPDLLDALFSRAELGPKTSG